MPGMSVRLSLLLIPCRLTESWALSSGFCCCSFPAAAATAAARAWAPPPPPGDSCAANWAGAAARGDTWPPAGYPGKPGWPARLGLCGDGHGCWPGEGIEPSGDMPTAEL